MTALAFTMIVSLMTVMMAFVRGMYSLTESSGQPGNVVILASGSTDEGFSTLAFDDVTFCYPGAESPVLCDISLTARPGQTTAIIGSTGAGKTTLLHLVPRLFDVTEGTVRLGGVDVRDLDLEVLWSRIGLVPQKPYLFSGSVADNLRLARPSASDADLISAAEAANAHGFVSEMPSQYDTPVGEGGTADCCSLDEGHERYRRPPLGMPSDTQTTRRRRGPDRDDGHPCVVLLDCEQWQHRVGQPRADKTLDGWVVVGAEDIGR